jgi:hypothetical protein
VSMRVRGNDRQDQGRKMLCRVHVVMDRSSNEVMHERIVCSSAKCYICQEVVIQLWPQDVKQNALVA